MMPPSVSGQAAFALLARALRHLSAALLFRRMMQRRIMLPWALRLGWSVPSRAK